MRETRFKVQYNASKFWLIFWLVVFFPVALALLLTSGSIRTDEKIYALNYQGSKGWLCFWALVFFPAAVVLFFLNGFSAYAETV